MKKYYVLLFFFISIWLFSYVLAQSLSNESERTWDTIKSTAKHKWKNTKNITENNWEKIKKQHNSKWLSLKCEIEKKWKKFIHSTNKDWVIYDQEKDVRSRIDFQKGEIILEAIVPFDNPKLLNNARNKIKEHALKIFTYNDIKNSKILEKQVIDKQGKAVSIDSLDSFLTKEVIPKVNITSVPFRSKDGVKRKQCAVHIKMVPNHIRLRAIKYLPIVKKYSNMFNIKPQLVLAIIHTESYFNPMAISKSNAIGIMQIIPKFAGQEAYNFLYKNDKLIDNNYLYNPENNIKIGIVYLHLLKYKYFENINDDLSRMYISTCAYNWGPTIIQKKIVDKYPISKMKSNDVYELLIQKTPKETINYLSKVVKRIPMYDFFFNIGQLNYN